MRRGELNQPRAVRPNHIRRGAIVARCRFEATRAAVSNREAGRCCIAVKDARHERSRTGVDGVTRSPTPRSWSCLASASECEWRVADAVLCPVEGDPTAAYLPCSNLGGSVPSLPLLLLVAKVTNRDSEARAKDDDTRRGRVGDEHSGRNGQRERDLAGAVDRERESDDRGENRHRPLSVGGCQPGLDLEPTLRVQLRDVLGDQEQEWPAERDRAERGDPERAGDGAPTQLERQRVAARQRVSRERDCDGDRGHDRDRVDPAASDPGDEQPGGRHRVGDRECAGGRSGRGADEQVGDQRQRKSGREPRRRQLRRALSHDTTSVGRTKKPAT